MHPILLFLNLILYFNSIKVQLERQTISNYIEQGLIFQFHKGTIRTSRVAQHKYTSKEFQFHKGTIRTKWRNKLKRRIMNFNSIKVQLERTYTI